MKAWTVGLVHDGSLLGYCLLQEGTPLSMGRYWEWEIPILDRLTERGFRQVLAINGPVVLDSESAEIVHRAFAEYLSQLQCSEGLYSVSVKPDYLSADHDPKNFVKIYSDFGFTTERRHTFVVQTDVSFDDLKRRIASKKRTKINKAEKIGIQVEDVANYNGVERYWKVRCENWKRNGQKVVPLKHFIDTWDVLRSHGSIYIFISVYEGKDLAAQTLFTCGSDVVLIGVAVSDYSISCALPGNDYLQWYVLQWAHKNGFSKVDYVGATPETTDPKLRAIHSFKKSWGGDLIEHFVFRRVRNNFYSRLKQVAEDPLYAGRRAFEIMTARFAGRE